jgi:hypothetical protein
MYVTRLLIDDDRIVDWESPETAMSHPTWQQIEEAIKGLDGTHRTLVTLGRDGGDCDYMVIVGGKGGVYTCGLYDADGREFAVVDPYHQGSTELIEIPAGQPSCVSKREALEVGTVLVAA